MTTYSGLEFWRSSKWPVAPLRRIASLGTGHTPSRSHPEYWDDCTVPWVTTEDLTKRTDSDLAPLMDTRQKISEIGLANSAAVLHPAGTVMLSRTASVGHVVRIGKPMATTQAFVTWTCGKAIDPRYLVLVLKTMAPEFARIAYGSTHLTIYMPDIEQLRVPVPPIHVQRAIADHVENETDRIDALIARKQHLLNLLDERIDAMVSTKIGRSALVDPSGSAVEIRRLLAKRRLPANEGEVVTAFRDGQVTARSLRRSQGYTEAWTENALFQQVRRGDVVVHGLDGFAGAVGTSEADGICSPVYHVLEPLDGGDSDFYGRLLHVLAKVGYLALFAVSTRERAVDFRNWDLFGRIPIPVVSVHEQKEIGTRIRALRPVRAAVTRSKALALEHRQALIAAAVKGELKISGVA